MSKSLKFWTLIAGLLAFTAKYYVPDFPLDEFGILSLLLTLLGLAGIVPTLQLARARGVAFVPAVAPVWKDGDFWKLAAGLAAFVLRFYFPDLPVDSDLLLGVIVLILAIFGIKPELVVRHQINKTRRGQLLAAQQKAAGEIKK